MKISNRCCTPEANIINQLYFNKKKIHSGLGNTSDRI